MGRPVRQPFEPDDQWRTYALCRFVEFPSHPRDRLEVDRACRVCEACPVRLQCDEYATTNNVMFGVWGGRPRGKTFRDRQTARLRMLQTSHLA